MKNQKFKTLSKTELQGGGLLDALASCFGRERLVQPGYKTKWVRKGTAEYTRKWTRTAPPPKMP